jgi:hypothetical protein
MHSVARARLCIAFCVANCLFLPAAHAQTDKLTNSVVIGWVKWGFPSDTIIANIQNNTAKSQFSFTQTDLQDLLTAGVSEDVIDAMVKASIASAKQKMAIADTPIAAPVAAPSEPSTQAPAAIETTTDGSGSTSVHKAPQTEGAADHRSATVTSVSARVAHGDSVPKPSVSGAATTSDKPTSRTENQSAGSGTRAAVTCPVEPVYDGKYVAPSIDKITFDVSLAKTDTNATLSGKMPKGTKGSILVCVDGKPTKEGPSSVDATDGSFTAKLDAGITAKQVIQTQLVVDATSSQEKTYGPASAKLPAGSCSKAAPALGGAAPVLSLTTDSNNVATYSGTVDDKTDGDQIRICVNDLPVAQKVKISSGKFNGGTDSFPVSAGDQITAQVIHGAGASQTFGPTSTPLVAKTGQVVFSAAKPAGKEPVSIIVAGVEYAGYSSQAQTTDGFFELFYKGPEYKGLSGWTRIRLTSAAQPATNGVVSIISNPTGLTSYNYSNVGQVLDFVAGPSWKLPKTDYWAAIASVGAITPLSSTSAPVTYVAPPPGTLECTALVNRFSSKYGYSPALMLNTAPNPTTCLAGGYTDIAFSNQDRTNLYLKYGGGFRTWYPFGGCKPGSTASNCSTAYAAADFTVGQDSSVTGGQLRRFVFKIDGLLPIKMGDSSWLYLFGSAYMRLEHNENFPPLLLNTPNPPITVPSANVFVLPLVQPNRDYYRLGVGLNINQLWCKAFNSTCTSKASSTNNSKPTIISLDPANKTHGSAVFTLTVKGTNFTRDSKIQWDGASLNTDFSSATEISAEITAADVAKARTVKVSVTNSGDSTSDTKDFKVN